MALAADKAYFTLPHAIQEFKVNLGFLPALWAGEGDLILVDDVYYAIKALSQIGKRHADVLFVTANDLRHWCFLPLSHGDGTKPSDNSCLMPA